MKRAILIIMVLLLSKSLFSQTKSSIMLNTGIGIPFSEVYFTDYWSPSYNFGGGFGLYLNSQLSLWGYIEFNNFSFNGSKALHDLDIIPKYNTEGGAANILCLSANIKYNLLDNMHPKISPYIIGGVSYSNFSISNLVTTNDKYRTKGILTNDKSVSALSINCGVGVEYLISPIISVFADIRCSIGFTNGDYLTISTSGDEPILSGTNQVLLPNHTSFIPLRVGILYNF